MKERKRPRHSPWLLATVGALLIALFVLYRVRPNAGLMAAAGSGAIGLIVIVHLGVLAAAVGAYLTWRRRRR
jgi:hypothetical protein